MKINPGPYLSFPMNRKAEEAALIGAGALAESVVSSTAIAVVGETVAAAATTFASVVVLPVVAGTAVGLCVGWIADKLISD